ncbi:response regulator transcription factor [Clostridium sp. DL1XJH146]
MYSILLVDDDVINRVAIVTMVDWQSLGFKITGQASNGKAALEFLENNKVHLIITDMKMPIMGGLKFIKEVRKKDKEVKVIALSSYDEFDLVRQAFKLDIEDYILKAELSNQYLTTFMLNIKEKLSKANNLIINSNQENDFEEYALGKKAIIGTEFENYYCLMIQIEDLESVRKRFVDLKNELFVPAEKILMQIPKVAKSCNVIEYTYSRLLVCYKTNEVEDESIRLLCRQVINVLKNYMNIEVSIGVSDWHQSSTKLLKSIEQAIKRLSLRYVYGDKKVFTEYESKEFDLKGTLAREKDYKKLLKSFKEFSDEELFQSQRNLFNKKEFENVDELKKKCINLIYFEALMLENNGDNIWNIWGRKVSFYNKFKPLVTSADVLMWMFNFDRCIMDYLKKKYENKINSDRQSIVKHYIDDNYANPDLSLREVASFEGLNEKYFSSKFKKECGMSFVEYLTKVRIDAAKSLIENTNMKLYEVSRAVGYNNAEHFARVFKKKVGISPREYGNRN